MAISKVIFNGDTLMDVTGDNPASDNMLTGTKATGANGQSVNGALVTAPASDTSPAMDGNASAGSASTYSRGDHVHPSDTSKQAKITASGILKGDGSGGVTAATSGTDYAAASHAHGNITSGGDITATAPTIASGDQIVINDNSASKITNGPTFDGSTTTKALTQKGTWETFLQSYTETDPTVPSWAKASSKPTYTASEVGALPDTTTIPTASTTNPSMDGTASYGSGTSYARSNHVHPTDTSRQAKITASGILKGDGSGGVSAATSGTDYAAASHAHGNITSGGDITATAPTIANGDQIIINDNSASKITNGPTFDGSTTTKALTPKGTWETFLQSYTETDPTVPSWAKQSTKPSYTASEVGALPDTTTIPTASTTNPSMDGTASYGSGTSYARSNHVHPTDTSRQAKITANGLLKGDGSGGVTAAVVGTDYIASHQDISGKLDKSGGTMTGPLILSGAPTASLHAATKQYVDENTGGIDPNKYYWYRQSYTPSYIEGSPITSAGSTTRAFAYYSSTVSSRCLTTCQFGNSFSYSSTTGEFVINNPTTVTFGNKSTDVSTYGNFSNTYMKIISYSSGTDGYPDEIFLEENRIFHCMGVSYSSSKYNLTFAAVGTTTLSTYYDLTINLNNDEIVVSSDVFNTYPNDATYMYRPEFYPYTYKYFNSGLSLGGASLDVSKYYWKRRTYAYLDAGPAYSSQSGSGFKLCYSYGSSDSTKYKNNVYNVSDSIYFNQADGTYSLVNPSQVTWGSSSGDSISVIGDWSGGKYIQWVSSIGTSTSGTCPAQSYPNSIFHVDGPVTVSGSFGAGYYYYAGAYQRYDRVTTPNINNDEIVVNANILNAYPNNDDFVVDSSLYPYVYKQVGAGIDLASSGWRDIAIRDDSNGLDLRASSSGSYSASEVLIDLKTYLNSGLLEKYSEFRFVVQVDYLLHNSVSAYGSVGGYYNSNPITARVYNSGTTASSGYCITPAVTVGINSDGTYYFAPTSIVPYDSNAGTGSSNSKSSLTMPKDEYYVSLTFSSSSSTAGYHGGTYKGVVKLQGRK